jgi:hypothetical protein
MKWILMAALAVGGGCGTEQCYCASAGLYIDAERVTVTAMVLSGEGCRAAQVVSIIATGGPSPPGTIATRREQGFVAGARSYSMSSEVEGACLVEVTLGDGTVARRDYAVRHQGGQTCCAGYYFNGESIWTLP